MIKNVSRHRPPDGVDVVIVAPVPGHPAAALIDDGVHNVVPSRGMTKWILQYCILAEYHTEFAMCVPHKPLQWLNLAPYNTYSTGFSGRGTVGDVQSEFNARTVADNP